MSRDRGASCKKCRRSRVKLYLKGERCFSPKCAIEKRNTPPGHRTGMSRRLSEYGVRLREKQKLRFFYSVTERQMRIYFNKASRQKGVTGYNLLKLFEYRLDNVIFRAGLAPSRKKARQLVLHKHFSLNGRKVNVPSMLVKQGDVITINRQKSEHFLITFEEIKDYVFPEWIEYNKSNNEFKIIEQPKYEAIDTPVDVQLIVEYYSR